MDDISDLKIEPDGFHQAQVWAKYKSESCKMYGTEFSYPLTLGRIAYRLKNADYIYVFYESPIDGVIYRYHKGVWTTYGTTGGFM